MKYLLWLLKAAIFFTLFAFALNNQQDATVHFFFGTQWRAPLVLVVLSAFTCGVAIGVLGMLPRWWRQRKAHKQTPAAANTATTASAAATAPVTSDLPLPPHGV
ncbi:MAG: LapA family protein [Giesbergeria sp.]|nr:LapA family protein [Giesbergeria sp.]